MMEIHDIQPLDGFNWDEFEKSSKSQVSSASEGYDEEPIFHQGIAIVKRNGKYGAIMVGGKEIVPPIYDALTEFTDGLAKARYEGKNRIVNLSGQVQVKKGKENVFLPEEYDWGFDFVKGLCVVLKNGRYGIIDKNFKCIVEPQYVSYEGFHKGFAFFQKDCSKPNDASHNSIDFEFTDSFPPVEETKMYDIINKDGNVVYSDVIRLSHGFSLVTIQSSVHYSEGIINKDFKLIFPIEYDHIEQLHSKLCLPTNSFFTLVKNGTSTIFDQKGVEYFSLKEDEIAIEFLQVGKLVVFKTKLDNSLKLYTLHIYNNKGLQLYVINGNINISGVYCILLESLYGNIFRLDHEGLWLAYLHYQENNNATGYIAKNRDVIDKELYRRLNVFSRDKNFIEVNPDYFYYNFSRLNESFFIVENRRNHLKGVADAKGKLIVDFQFVIINYLNDSNFIGVKLISKDHESHICYGIFDSTNNEILPFKYCYLEGLEDGKLLFSIGKHVTVENGSFATINFNICKKSNLLGLMDSNFKVLCLPKYNSIDKFIANDFYKVRIGLSYGLVNSSGDEIIPIKFCKIETTDATDSIAVVYYLEGTRRNEYHNKVNKDGKFVVKSSDSNSFFVSANQFDWCGDFNSKGYAEVLKEGLHGKINKKERLISIIENELVEVPQKFDWAYDFVGDFAKVKIGKYWGIVNKRFDLIIKCCYEEIYQISSDFFVFQNNNKYGVVSVDNKVVIDAEYIGISYLGSGLFKVRGNGYGVISNTGAIILPPKYSNIISVESNNRLYWIVTLNEKKGVLCDGKIIIPLIYDTIKSSNNYFECIIQSRNNKNDVTIKYNYNGNVILNYLGQLLSFPKDYVIVFETSIGLFRVMKDNKWGIIDQKAELVVSCEYSYISDFQNGIAFAGKSESVVYDVRSNDFKKGVKYGIIDTFGNIVLPTEYDSVVKWDNDYYLAIMEGKTTLLSPCFHPIFETIYELEKLDNNYILTKRTGQTHFLYGLIDYNGNIIVPLDDEHGSERIEILDNGFIKVTYYKLNHNGYIAILNCQGKAVYENRDCDDIFYVGFGSFCVKGNGYIGGKSYDTYKLVNLQGKDILDSSYRQINVKDNGTINIQGNDGWGVADMSGNIIICPKYSRELIFKDGFADVQILDSSFTQKINEKGIVFVHNGKDEIKLPDNVYWGTDYVNGLSIVRRKGIGCHVIGVVDIKGNMIIPAQYRSVTLLSDNTIRVMVGDCYGLFDLKGNTILPPIFTDIYYIAKDRILVEWNLNIAKEWDNTGYIPGNSYTKYKGSDGDLDYRACNRSALCNSKGEIINDKELSYVKNFVNNYAKAYKKIEKGKIKLNTKTEVIEVDAIKYRQVGVIDLSGNTIVQPIYDSIDLYKKSAYVKVCKDGKYGIIHLPSKSMKMYDDIPIKHMWDVDALGRCVYSEDCEYDDDSDDWIGGTRGVLNPQGVLVPPGKYTDICLIDNGLIEVSNDDGNLYGLLDKEGKEILPIKYTYISSFKGNYATICIGGEKDYYSYRMIKGGKWGVIDNTGKIIKECVCDEEEVLEGKVCDNNKTDNEKTFIRPSVILSDSIPEPRERNSYDYYDSYRDDYDEGPHSKYGGYNGWDDDTIDEAFDGNPELTWNID